MPREILGSLIQTEPISATEPDVVIHPARWENVNMPSALPVALARQQIRCQVNRAEMMMIEAKAREEGKSVGNYVRARLGLPDRNAGRPTVGQLEAEQDQAWEILRGLGVDPAAFFPADDSWLNDYR